MILLLGFILETFLNEEKKLPHGKGLFGGKVFKNSARYIVCKNTFSWAHASIIESGWLNLLENYSLS